LILGDVDEEVTTKEIDEDTDEEIKKVILYYITLNCITLRYIILFRHLKGI
jgi:hypothetical protein